jgi:hypothetical protein
MNKQEREMKVYLGYQVYYNGCDQFETVAKVFDCEVKALFWEEEFTSTDPGESRKVIEFEVE